MKQKIKTALISVSDKADLAGVLKTLNKYKIKFISSGGTYKSIKQLGFSCTDVSKYTGFKEMLDGRVKTFLKFLAAARTIAGPPISIFSIISLLFLEVVTIFWNG